MRGGGWECIVIDRGGLPGRREAAARVSSSKTLHFLLSTQSIQKGSDWNLEDKTFGASVDGVPTFGDSQNPKGGVPGGRQSGGFVHRAGTRSFHRQDQSRNQC